MQQQAGQAVLPHLASRLLPPLHWSFAAPAVSDCPRLMLCCWPAGGQRGHHCSHGQPHLPLLHGGAWASRRLGGQRNGLGNGGRAARWGQHLACSSSIGAQQGLANKLYSLTAMPAAPLPLPCRWVCVLRRRTLASAPATTAAGMYGAAAGLQCKAGCNHRLRSDDCLPSNRSLADASAQPPALTQIAQPRTLPLPHPCSAYLTFVALSRKDPAGGPPTRLALPKVVPTDRYHEQIHSEAARR